MRIIILRLMDGILLRQWLRAKIRNQFVFQDISSARFIRI